MKLEKSDRCISSAVIVGRRVEGSAGYFTTKIRLRYWLKRFQECAVIKNLICYFLREKKTIKKIAKINKSFDVARDSRAAKSF